MTHLIYTDIYSLTDINIDAFCILTVQCIKSIENHYESRQYIGDSTLSQKLK